MKFCAMIRLSVFVFLLSGCFGYGLCSGETTTTQVEKVAPGIWKIRAGKPEKYTPTTFREREPLKEALDEIPGGDTLPFSLSNIKIRIIERGCIIEIPMDKSEKIYGFGLQINSFQQKGLRKQLIMNCRPVSKVGFTNAPVPFYVSTKGYGVFVDTARYPTFYCGSHFKRERVDAGTAEQAVYVRADGVYMPREITSGDMVIDIPTAKGVDIYIFTGSTIREVVRRYNLFSGGGCLPPMWGLGIKYRVKIDFTADDALRIAEYFRTGNIPCDMFGMEPGWQTHAYSSTYIWDPGRFPDPDAFITALTKMDYKLNIWEHAYVHPESPLYKPLKHMSGDYSVWNGLIPDLADKKVRDIFADYHDDYLVKNGVTAFKCDECDNADYMKADKAWGFPECTIFPSGIDGEQMHQLFGILYQKTMYEIFKKHNRRTYLDVRASHALAAPYPSTLYSDIYGHRDYIRLLVNGGFAGLLWSPEIRSCNSTEDLFRRLQSSILAPQTCIDTWFMRNPPWLQFDRRKNNNDEFLDNALEIETTCRKLLEIRMSLIPYLYSCFAAYRFEGIPPFRALVMDYPDNPEVHDIDDEFLIGESLLAAPLFAGSNTRDVYFPEGAWYCFNTGKKYQGRKTHTIETGFDQLPLFVREGSILPLARPVQYVDTDTVFEITCHVYGSNDCRPFTLFEDDGVTFDFRQGMYNLVELCWNGNKGTVKKTGNYKGNRYKIVKWVEAVR